LCQGFEGDAQSNHRLSHRRDVVIDFPENLSPFLLLFLNAFRSKGEEREFLLLGSQVVMPD